MNENLNNQSTLEQETTNGSEQPTFDGQQPPMFGGMQQQGGFGGGMQPQGNMWGNERFAGEDMFSGNNFAPGNFGAPSDLSGIVDNSSADISVNIGEQNNFANFAQGGMPPMFGGQGGQFNQPPQQAAQTQAE